MYPSQELVTLENPLIQRDNSVDRFSPVSLAWQELSVFAMVPDSSTFKPRKTFRDRLKLFAEPKKRIKRILNNASGFIASGTLMAIMGSSGAGKSTLMTTLAYRNALGTIVQGDVLINGQSIGPVMHEISGFVYQEDIFQGSLTVREHLTFMVRLKLKQKLARPEINAKILEVTKRAGLHRSCLNRRIGEDSDTKKVLSGGEKKRLSFATELISDPLILFCDEPTTGLDSFNAKHLIATMKKLTNQGTITICTIHQPSQEIFSEFDQVMLLAEGRLAFAGSPNQAIEFFQHNGFELPECQNPAEFLINSLSTKGQNRSKRISELFAVSSIATEKNNLIQMELEANHKDSFWGWKVKDMESRSKRTERFWFTIFLLAGRSLINVRRNPAVQTMRFIQKILIAVMCGLCFFGALNLDQLGVQAVQGAIFIAVSENSFHPMYSVLVVFPEDFPIFIRETKNGLYNTLQYYLANLLGMLPGLITEPMAFVCIFYFLAGFNLTLYGFLMTCLVTFLVINVATACGTFFSVTFNSVAFSMAYLVPFDYILMITSGVFVQLSTLPSYLRWMKYMSWFMYSTESLSIIQWEGVTNITCPADPRLPCLLTGEEVLERYSFEMGNLNRDLMAMVALYLIFHILGFIFLYRRTK